MRTYLTISASALAICAAQTAAAQDFYVGFGLEYGDADFVDNVFAPTSDSLSAGSLIGGVRFDTASNLFFAAEVETTAFIDNGDSTLLVWDIDRLSRLRGIAGLEFQNFSLFAAVGGAHIKGDALGSSFSDSGLSFGVGAYIPVSDRFDIRIEAMHDNVDFTSGGYNYEWTNTSLRVGAILKF